MSRLLLMICLVCMQHAGYTQERVITDSSPVVVRSFTPGNISTYRSDPDFQYERFSEPPKSVLDRLWRWVWQKLDYLFNSKGKMKVVRYILITIAIAALVFALLKVSGMTRAGLFGKENKSGDLPYSLLEDDIHAISFDDAIRQAVDDRNFRFAVRLLYLQSLKFLADRQLINWQLNRTNDAYIHDLAGNVLQPGFRNLTSRFEHNWYGNVPVEEPEFRQVREQFNQFNRQIT